MAVVTRTIGASGDYTSIAAWMADLSNGAVYTSGDEAIGEVIDWTLIGTGTFPAIALPTLVTLRPRTDRRHRGIAGSGCRLLPRTNVATLTVNNTTYEIIIDGFEIDYEGTYSPINLGGITVTVNTVSAGPCTLRNCIVYNTLAASGGSNVFGVDVNGASGSATVLVENCIASGIRRNATFGGCQGFRMARTTGTTVLRSCMAANCDNPNTGAAQGILCTMFTSVYNCISINNKSADYTGTFSAASNNASGDGTAFGTSSLTNTSFRELAAPNAGNANHRSGSPLIGAGLTIAGHNVDLAGNVFASPRSIGPLEFLPPTSSGIPIGRLISGGV